MLTIGKYDVVGWDYAITCAHIQADSLLKNSDSKWFGDYDYFDGTPVWTIGPKDLRLMRKLIKSDSRKFMGYISVYGTIKAPLWWWMELDRFDIESTISNFTSKAFTIDDFSNEDLVDKGYADSDEHGQVYQPSIDNSMEHLNRTIEMLNYYREKYIKARSESIKKRYLWQIINLLPSSYNQVRVVKTTYKEMFDIYNYSCLDRSTNEWDMFCDWIETLPYSELITRKEPNKKPGFKEIMEAYDRQVSEMIANEKE